MRDTIAIDFGTMRTKLSYFDPEHNTVELMRLGQEERLFVPSVFYLGQDGSRLFGDDAVEYLDSDSLGFLQRPLKRDLREQWVRAGNRVKATPTELLTLLFSNLRERSKELPHFREALPTGLSLTIPTRYGPPDKTILESAAYQAGFQNTPIQFVVDPIAAAQAWLHRFARKEEFVIVLDCGGGTLDWACLHRAEGDTFELIPELPSDGDNRVGGYDIDEALCKHVDDKVISAGTPNELVTNGVMIRERLRIIKEKYSRTGIGGNIRVGDTTIQLLPADLDCIFYNRYISQAVQNLNVYLEKVRDHLKREALTVLLVGGSARLRGLRETIGEQCRCKVDRWERSEYATVLGALEGRKPLQKTRSSAAVKHRDAMAEGAWRKHAGKFGVFTCILKEDKSFTIPDLADPRWNGGKWRWNADILMFTYNNGLQAEHVFRGPDTFYENNTAFLYERIASVSNIVGVWRKHAGDCIRLCIISDNHTFYIPDEPAKEWNRGRWDWNDAVLVFTYNSVAERREHAFKGSDMFFEGNKAFWYERIVSEYLASLVNREVALRACNNKYVSCDINERGGVLKACWADKKGDWERFYLVEHKGFYYLKSCQTGHFVTVQQDDVESGFLAANGVDNTPERFAFHVLDTHMNILAYNGKWVMAHKDRCGQLYAWADHPQEWERFTLEAF